MLFEEKSLLLVQKEWSPFESISRNKTFYNTKRYVSLYPFGVRDTEDLVREKNKRNKKQYLNLKLGFCSAKQSKEILRIYLKDFSSNNKKISYSSNNKDLVSSSLHLPPEKINPLPYTPGKKEYKEYKEYHECLQISSKENSKGVFLRTTKRAYTPEKIRKYTPLTPEKITPEKITPEGVQGVQGVQGVKRSKKTTSKDFLRIYLKDFLRIYLKDFLRISLKERTKAQSSELSVSIFEKRYKIQTKKKKIA